MMKPVWRVTFSKCDDFWSLLTTNREVRYLCTITDKFEWANTQLKADSRELFEALSPKDL